MSLNPLAIAFKGKGTAAVIRRAGTIVGRYGVTAGKMRNALALLASVLREFDQKASLPVTAVTLARNRGIAQAYQAQGIEFAVHGLVHIDYSQLSFEDQCAHVAQARQIFDACGIRAIGFRCPYLRWNNDTLRALVQNGFRYDSSQAIAWDVAQGYPIELGLLPVFCRCPG
jgi:peptidoglycan/xylan/chitin deacetylase (PgdA/CDA1 family)